MSIDSSFVRAVSPDASAAAPSGPSLLRLREETEGGGVCETRVAAEGSVGQGGQHVIPLAASDGSEPFVPRVQIPMLLVGVSLSAQSMQSIDPVERIRQGPCARGLRAALASGFSNPDLSRVFSKAIVTARTARVFATELSGGFTSRTLSAATRRLFQFSNPRRFFQRQKETAMMEEALWRESREGETE
jgi:hypothetical protein